MKPLTPIGSPSPLRLLNKGPDYLRRQIESSGRGRSVSAVERLEADKAKYVKSQQVINTKQEPVLIPCTTPPPIPRRPLTVPGASSPCLSRHRPPAAPYSFPGPLGLRAENEEDSKKENRHVLNTEERNQSNITNATPTPVTIILPLVAPHSAPILRRSTAKRMLRPDSLIIYRQKKECKSPTSNVFTNGEVKNYSFVRRLFQGSMREKAIEASTKINLREERSLERGEDCRMSWNNDRNNILTKSLGKAEDEPKPVRSINNTLERTKGSVNGDCEDPWKPVIPLRTCRLQRSKSDLRLRCSLALSEMERFFDYCGLDQDMVQRLGAENFLTGGSSADTLSLMLRSVNGGGEPGSEPSEFSRHSGEGLFQEELCEQLPTGVSIIERNARVIKWLYSCKNAAQEGPKESTV